MIWVTQSLNFKHWRYMNIYIYKWYDMYNYIYIYYVIIIVFWHTIYFYSYKDINHTTTCIRILLFIITSLLWKEFDFKATYTTCLDQKNNQQKHEKRRFKMMGFLDFPISASTIHVFQGPKGALGGCETDGPLGALAVLRALCARGQVVFFFLSVKECGYERILIWDMRYIYIYIIYL